MSHQPLPRISLKEALWEELIRNLRERGGDIRESGAFLLGTADSIERIATRFVLYDDLDPKCLNKGYVQFDGTILWSSVGALCTGFAKCRCRCPYPPLRSRTESFRQNAPDGLDSWAYCSNHPQLCTGGDQHIRCWCIRISWPASVVLISWSSNCKSAQYPEWRRGP